MRQSMRKSIEEREEQGRLKFVVSEEYLAKVRKLRDLYERNKQLYQHMALLGHMLPLDRGDGDA